MPEPPILRAYQGTAVAKVRAAFAARKRRVLFVLPTGGGKTVVFSYVASGAAARGRRVVIVVHRRELLRQASRALTAVGVPHGLIAPGAQDSAELVQVASVDTLARRLDRVEPFDLVVIDEAHHAVAGTWQRVLEAFPEAFVLGVTATPERLDGRGLGGVFHAMVQGPSVADLTAAGWLVPATVYAPPAQVDLSSVKRRAGDYAVEELADLCVTNMHFALERNALGWTALIWIDGGSGAGWTIRYDCQCPDLADASDLQRSDVARVLAANRGSAKRAVAEKIDGDLFFDAALCLRGEYGLDAPDFADRPSLH